MRRRQRKIQHHRCSAEVRESERIRHSLFKCWRDGDQDGACRHRSDVPRERVASLWPLPAMPRYASFRDNVRSVD